MALLVFLTTALYVPGLEGPATTGRWSVLALGVPLLLLLTPITRWHWLWLAFIAFLVVSLAWTASIFDTLGGLWQIVLLIAAWSIAFERQDLQPVWNALTWGVWVSVPFVLLQFVGFAPVVVANHNVAGLFLNKDMLAEIAVLALIACIWQRQWLMAIGPMICTVIPFARETAIVAFALLTTWLWHRYRWRGLWISACLGWIVCAWLAIDMASYDRFVSGSARLVMWDFALENLTWLGHGLGSFQVMLPQFGYAHSEPIQALFELGIGALIPAVIFLYALGGPYGLERLVLIAVAAESLVSFPLHMPATALVAALVAGDLCGFRVGVRQYELDGRPRDLLGITLSHARSSPVRGSVARG